MEPGQDPPKRRPAVDLVAATPEQRPILGRMMQLYLHDFSAVDGVEIGADGLYDYAYLNDGSYWSEPDRHPFLILADGHLAGFVLVSGHSVIKSAGIRAIAEFFVIRKYRRSGVGRAAASAVFDRLPGAWEVAVMKENVEGVLFWRNMLTGYAGDALHEEQIANAVWDGPVFFFDTAPAAGLPGERGAVVNEEAAVHPGGNPERQAK